MKKKTSVTLAEETVQAIDEIAGEERNRSRVIEEAVREYVERRRREQRDRREVEILNRHAEELNREAEDVLAFQSEP
ncbi:MAG: ribbon-helix-helix protein, CopG family [Thermoanaerobaculia bacterium]